MWNFEYYAPTRVVFGKDTQSQVGQLVKQFGGKKVLIHYGGGSVIKSGLLECVQNALNTAGISFVTLGGVVPNPQLGKVREAVALCKKEQVDFILAVGGGSVIDSAKATALSIANNCDAWDFYSGKAQATACLPLGAVLTIAAAGSEMSNSSVITNEDGMLKRGYTTDFARCKFAVLNPELTYSLPTFQTACGCADILMHTMERYFSKEKDTELRDGISGALMRTVIEFSSVLKEQPEDYNARAQIMWAGSLAHNDLTGPRNHGDWASHQLEHELSGIYGVAHGAGLTAIWGSWARYVYQEDVARFARFAVNVLGISIGSASQEEIALAGIKAMEDFYTSIDLPISISQLDINLADEDLKLLAHKCSFEGQRKIGSFKVLAMDDMETIYRMAR